MEENTLDPQRKMGEHLSFIKEALGKLAKDASIRLNKELFIQLASTIQDLEVESRMSEKTGGHKKTCQLVHHLLETPWGAPFTMPSTLLEAAETYRFQSHESSDLYQFIQNFSKHDEKAVFKALDSILNHLKSLKKETRRREKK